ncbi:MAG: Fpg/Nei family DNA glycosylase [Limisphaerales bacterium]
MPELAEVEYFRKQWGRGLRQKILSVESHASKKIFRGTDVVALSKTLGGATLLGSEAHGKQMLFRFSNGGWLGIHLGMTGKLRIEPADAVALKHDHLILRQSRHSLILSDPRQFGRVLFHRGKTEPAWWRNRPAQILSRQFTRARVEQFLSRHGRAPIKAVLLLQSGFPGIGNWMADEILWQSKIHPARLAGKLHPRETRKLYSKIQSVSRAALRTVGKNDGDLPKSWLFHRRWEEGGHCPADGSALCRGQCGGRTTCWCPSCQKRAVHV